MNVLKIFNHLNIPKTRVNLLFFPLTRIDNFSRSQIIPMNTFCFQSKNLIIWDFETIKKLKQNQTNVCVACFKENVAVKSSTINFYRDAIKEFH